MNEEAVKKLTEQGCMVGKDAAEIITKEDVEMIGDLEATPMYVSDQMLVSLRKKMSQKVVVGSDGSTMKEEVSSEVEGEASVDRVQEQEEQELKDEQHREEAKEAPRTRPRKEKVLIRLILMVMSLRRSHQTSVPTRLLY